MSMSGSPPAIIEPAIAPIIFGDKVRLEVKPDTIWCHIFTTHHQDDGSIVPREEVIVVFTTHAFAEALQMANGATAGPVSPPVKASKVPH